MAGRPKRKAYLAQQAALKKGLPIPPAYHPNNHPRPTHEVLADIYSERYTTFDALRAAMVQNGIVEHGLNPYEVIQRAIDDTSMDYLLTRRKIDKDSKGDPNKLVDHDLYDHMVSMREAMVRYSTFAMQYDIQRRQIRLSETRIALLAATLRDILPKLGVEQQTIKQVPRLLVEYLSKNQPNMDPHKATALAEILHRDAEIVIEETDDEGQNGSHA